ncbi:MAG: hypothetical protein EU548_05960 [Promethearchaeota archaeon]|nr:MAG: hypothetical protein EU548_05960 [Candidatus Lokiarchaeota archaeon]
MAKKKSSKNEDLDDEDFGGLDSDDLEIAIPKIGKKEGAAADEEGLEEDLDELEPSLEEEFEPLPEEEEELPTYKYLSVNEIKSKGNNDYEVIVEGQSHGLLNVLVKNLLKVEGVAMAAYKDNKLDLPTIYIRLTSDTLKIKDILYESIETLKNEVIEIQKLFKKVI